MIFSDSLFNNYCSTFKGVCLGKPLLLLLVLLGELTTISSKDFVVYRDQVFRKKVHLHFNTPLSFSPRAKTDFKHPDFRQNFYPSLNFRFGLTGMYNFNPHYSLSFGLNLYWFSFNSMRYEYRFPVYYYDLLSIPVGYRFESEEYPTEKFKPYPFFFSLPLHFIHRIPVSNKIDLRYGVGLDLKLCASVLDGISLINSDSLGNVNAWIYRFQYQVGNDKSFVVKPDALFSAGINRYLKNNKYINANFFVSVPLYKPIRGEFEFFQDTPYAAPGTFKKSDLAFGFEFNYVFTFVRKDKRMKSKNPSLD